MVAQSEVKKIVPAVETVLVFSFGALLKVGCTMFSDRRKCPLGKECVVKRLVALTMGAALWSSLQQIR